MKLIYLALISSCFKKTIQSGSQSVIILALHITEEKLTLSFGIVLCLRFLQKRSQNDTVV